MSIVLGFVLFLACAPSALIDHVEPVWRNEPKMEMRDAYKWIYQATNGGEHAAPGEAAARKWLDPEWDAIGEPREDEKLWEPLCADGSIGRLNLRPFKKNGGTKDAVLEAFLRSAAEYKSDGGDFLSAWNELGKRLKKKDIGKLSHAAWKEFDAEMKAADYPAVHHSETYSNAYEPAYRIITKAELERLRPAFETPEP